MRIVHYANYKIYELMRNYTKDMKPVELMDAIKNGGLTHLWKQGEVYQKSQFNYVVQDSEQYIVYNSLYQTVALLNPVEWDLFYCGNWGIEFARELEAQGLIVPANLEERRIYQQIAGKLRTYSGRKCLNLTILPTLKCNARCFYCFQQGVEQYELTKDSAKGIIDFIEKNPELEELNLTWFGGEPLMRSDLIQYICDWLYIKKIKFHSSMVSNGYFFDCDQIVQDAKRYWKLKRVQITLDGLEATYNQRKNYQEACENPFQRILENINRLTKAQIYVTIRMNIDKNNVEETIKLAHFLADQFSGNNYVSAYGEFIRDNPESNSNILIRTEERKNVMDMLIPILIDGNLCDAERELFSMPSVNACMFDAEYAFIINPDGTICKCENESGKQEYCIGDIYDDPEELKERRRSYVQSEECSSCWLYPLCFGGCQYSSQLGLPPCFLKKYSVDALLKSYVQSEV